MIGRLIKYTALATAIAGAIAYGEFKQPISNYVQQDPLLPAANTPKQYWTYETRVMPNDSGTAKLYFGSDSTNVWRQVNEDGTVGKLSENFDSWFEREITDPLRDWLD